MSSFAFFCAGLIGLSSVAFGAYGAHSLKGLDPHLMASFQTAIRYAMNHALLLAIFGILAFKSDGFFIRLGLVATLLGTLIFSGSIIVRTLTGNAALTRYTPFGGTILIGAWGCLVVSALLLGK